MRDAMAHRGPDDSDVQILDNVGLVHTRLSIVDLSPRGHQPMRHPGGRWWLAYNGEIYNHRALREQLVDASFVGTSDTETLLWGLDRWGLEVLPRLTGQFAFAALDLERRCLFLCRDRFGIKPLYLARSDGDVWFASELAALIAAGVAAKPIDDAWEAISAGSYLGGERTLLDGITRIGQGSSTAISLEDATVRSERWHRAAADVDPRRASDLTRRRRSELTTILERTLREAVHGALLSDAKVGTLCSGGLDSSLITALALEAKSDLVAFGASCKVDGTVDEGVAASRVAAKLGIELELVDVTPAAFRQFFVPATVHSGSPLGNASAVTVAQLAHRARECGVKVVLTGEGADELFGGYVDLHARGLAAFMSYPQRILHAGEALVFGPRSHLVDRGFVTTEIKRVGKAVLALPATSHWMPMSTSDEDPAPSEESLAAYAHHAGERRVLEAGLLTNLDYTLCWLLNRMDKNVMQSSVEARVPFLEPPVVELVANLPLEVRVGPWSKGILRDVARRLLPISVAHRPKIYGMDFDAVAWIEEAADPAFLHHGLLRETLRIPQPAFVAAVNGASNVHKLRVWSAEAWCRSTFDAATVPEIEAALWR